MGATRSDRAVLFDFFGTLVEYQPARTELVYPETFALARSWGLGISVEEFVAVWDASSRRLEAESRQSLREFEMTDAAAAFAAAAGLALTREQCAELGRRFVDEWQQHIHPIEGVAEMVRRLAVDWQVGIVSNTHDRHMVPRMLADMGIDGAVSLVTLSVVHGRCKPHRSIYDDALSAISVVAANAVFVGDSHEADFVGPRAVGMTAYLIDPHEHHEIPRDRRLTSVLDLEARIAEADIGG